MNPSAPRTKNPITLPKSKVCNCCGAFYTEIPAGAAYSPQGFFFNCGCGSTLMVRANDNIFEQETA